MIETCTIIINIDSITVTVLISLIALFLCACFEIICIIRLIFPQINFNEHVLCCDKMC